MDDTLLIAATGMWAIQQTLDDAAHNTVNANTPGYQRHRVIIQRFQNILDDAQNRQELLGVKELVSFEQGELIDGNSPYSLALEGKGFFEVQDEQGKSYFTRNGELTVDPTGHLVTRAGYQVQSLSGLPIQFKPTGGKPVINPDGSVLQGATVIGKVKVVEFKDSDRQRLKPVGETLFAAPENVSPTGENNTLVRQGYLEIPRFTAPMSLVQMLLSNRNYEGIQRAIKAINESHESLLRTVA